MTVSTAEREAYVASRIRSRSLRSQRARIEYDKRLTTALSDGMSWRKAVQQALRQYDSVIHGRI